LNIKFILLCHLIFKSVL